MSGDDRYRKGERLSPAGLYQLAAEEARRPGAPSKKQRVVLSRLAAGLELEAHVQREIEDLAETKQSEGRLGGKRKFSRRQLYARTLRYAFVEPELSRQDRHLLGVLRAAMGYTDADHEKVLDALIDQGWAPPHPAASGEIKIKQQAEGSFELQDAAALKERARRIATQAEDAQADASEDDGALEGSAGSRPAPVAPEEDPDVSDAEDKSRLEMATDRMKKVPGQPARVRDLLKTQSGEMRADGALEPASSDEIRPNLFETMSGLPMMQESSAGRLLHSIPASRRPLVVGIVIGVLLALVPASFMLGLRWANAPGPAPTKPPPATQPATQPATRPPTQAPPPTRAPQPDPPPRITRPIQVPPLQPDGSEPRRPAGEVLVETLPALAPGPDGGLQMLEWIGAELMRRRDQVPRAMRQHLKVRRRDLDRRFAMRNEAIFEGGRDPTDNAGGYEARTLLEAQTFLRGVEDEGDLAAGLTHAYYLVLLGFYVDPTRYEDDLQAYQSLIPLLLEHLHDIPDLEKSGSRILLRVLGEDLRDTDNEGLQALGLELLGAMMAPN